MPFKEFIGFFQCVFIEIIVTVKEIDIFCPYKLETVVSCMSLTLVFLSQDCDIVRIFFPIFKKDIGG